MIVEMNITHGITIDWIIVAFVAIGDPVLSSSLYCTFLLVHCLQMYIFIVMVIMVHSLRCSWCGKLLICVHLFDTFFCSWFRHVFWCSWVLYCRKVFLSPHGCNRGSKGWATRHWHVHMFVEGISVPLLDCSDLSWFYLNLSFSLRLTVFLRLLFLSDSFLLIAEANTSFASTFEVHYLSLSYLVYVLILIVLYIGIVSPMKLWAIVSVQILTQSQGRSPWVLKVG